MPAILRDVSTSVEIAPPALVRATGVLCHARPHARKGSRIRPAPSVILTTMVGGDAAFIAQHAAMVRSIAKRIKRERKLTSDLEDLIADGNVGLLQARQTFAADHGIKFEQYAYYRVMHAMFDGVRRSSSMPWRTVEAIRRQEAVAQAAEAVGELNAEKTEVRDDLPSATDRLQGLAAKAAAAFAIRAAAQEHHRSPDDVVIGKDMVVKLERALHRLSENDAKFVREIYWEGRLLRELGATEGVSEATACRRLAKILAVVREWLE